MLENNWPNPFINAPTRDISKLNEMKCTGMEGIKPSPVPKPNNVNITPIIEVITKPRNTAAGTFLRYNIKVSMMPITAKSVGADEMLPIPTKVEELPTIIPAPFKPTNARKKPMPAPIANFRSKGMALRMASLKPDMVINKKSMLETNTAARAVSQVLPILIIMVYMNTGIIPMPGARPTGYFEISPVMIQEIPEATAVAKNTPVAGIPPWESNAGFTPKI